jgi:2-methylcitrate dehydratase PrpD
VPSAVVRTIGEPIEVKRAPETGYQAQFSGPFAVVAGLVGDGSGLGMGLDDYSDVLAQDPERRRLMALVSVVGNDECDAIFPHQFPAVVRLTTSDGTVHEEKVLANRGGPQRPLSDEELALKFRMNCAGTVADDVADDVQRRVLSFGDGTSVSALLADLASALPHLPRTQS